MIGISERFDPGRRVTVVAASALAITALSSLAPAPSGGAASAGAGETSSTTSTSVTSLGSDAVQLSAATVAAAASIPASRTALAAPAAPGLRAATPAVAPRPAARANAVAPFRFATVQYNQWWAKRIMAQKYGWRSALQFKCLVSLWLNESHWNHRSYNHGSGAAGIPQALPGSKMRSAGKDWRTNPVTQIKWGLRYIKGVYGSPCGAWGHFQSHNWY